MALYEGMRYAVAAQSDTAVLSGPSSGKKKLSIWPILGTAKESEAADRGTDVAPTLHHTISVGLSSLTQPYRRRDGAAPAVATPLTGTESHVTRSSDDHPSHNYLHYLQPATSHALYGPPRWGTSHHSGPGATAATAYSSSHPSSIPTSSPVSHSFLPISGASSPSIHAPTTSPVVFPFDGSPALAFAASSTTGAPTAMSSTLSPTLPGHLNAAELGESAQRETAIWSRPVVRKGTQLQLQQQQHPPSSAGHAVLRPPASVVPPFRFARVESGVFRGAYPVLRNFPFLKLLQLRTIVSMIPEPPTYDLQCFAAANGIQLHHLSAERSKGEAQILPNELNKAVELVVDCDRHPLYIHCLDGRHVVGLVVMVLRKLMQWDTAANHQEYLRFTREVQDELSFIADCTGPVLIPTHLPQWLWGGSLYDAATGQLKRLPTTMRLKFATALGGSSGGAGSHQSKGGAITTGMASSPPASRGAGPVTPDTVGSPTSPFLSHATAHSGEDGGPSPLVPWMRVRQAEVVAEDGYHYLDVNRLPLRRFSTAIDGASVTASQALASDADNVSAGNSGVASPFSMTVVALASRDGGHGGTTNTSASTSTNSSIVGHSIGSLGGAVHLPTVRYSSANSARPPPPLSLPLQLMTAASTGASTASRQPGGNRSGPTGYFHMSPSQLSLQWLGRPQRVGNNTSHSGGTATARETKRSNSR